MIFDRSIGKPVSTIFSHLAWWISQSLFHFVEDDEGCCATSIAISARRTTDRFIIRAVVLWNWVIAVDFIIRRCAFILLCCFAVANFHSTTFLARTQSLTSSLPAVATGDSLMMLIASLTNPFNTCSSQLLCKFTNQLLPYFLFLQESSLLSVVYRRKLLTKSLAMKDSHYRLVLIGQSQS